MEQLCHRCGTAINDVDPFCPHCGAPQLRYEAPEESGSSSNLLPAQRFSARSFDAISWRDAIHAATILSIPAGILSALLGFEVLWVLGGGVVAVSLYHRRTGTPPTRKMGWRIGMLVGLFAAVVAAAFNGVALLVQRYGFHQGAVIDQRLHDVIDSVTKIYTNFLANSNPDMAKSVADSMHFWLTPNGIAAMVLSNAAEMAVFMLLFAAVGGALGARLTAKSPQHSVR
jgi:zinc-ribbon domain